MAAAELFVSAPDTPAPAPALAEDTATAWPTPSLAAGLVALQGRLPRITKGLTADVRGDRANYSYQYADLADVSASLLPIMSSVGLAFTARPTLVDGQLILVYALVHVSGEREEGIYPLPTSGNPQAVGSAITYARRYCLLAVTGAHPDHEDDDAQDAMPPRGRGQDRAPAPAPVDQEFMAEARRRIDSATARGALRGIWHTVAGARDQGRIDQAASDQLAERMKARSAHLAAEPTEPPLDQAPTEAGEPEPGPVGAPAPDEELAEPPLDQAPTEATASTTAEPEPRREEQVAALRARAARIAAEHTRKDTLTDD